MSTSTGQCTTYLVINSSFIHVEIISTFMGFFFMLTFENVAHTTNHFTLLTSYLCQYINRGFTFSSCLLNGAYHWRKCSVRTLVHKIKREDLYLSLFSFSLMTYQCLNGAIPSRKLFIGGPDLARDLPSKKYVIRPIHTNMNAGSLLNDSWVNTDNLRPTAYIPILEFQIPTQTVDT